MAQTIKQIQELLTSAFAEPRKRFGQNFMIDPNIVRLVTEAGLIGAQDTVIEVGPGTGTLTEELLPRAGRVIAVEIDRDLAQLLRDRFSDNPKFQLIEGDVLNGKHAINEELLSQMVATPLNPRPPIKLVANLPYNIASPLVLELLIAGVDMLAFTVQKEVAERLRAPVHDESYGTLSVMAQLLAKVEVLRTISPKVFWPAPKVDSALVRMTSNNQLGDVAHEFSRFVHGIFGFRRKMIKKAMGLAGHDPGVLQKMQINPQLRPQDLSPAQFRSLFDAIRVSRG